MSDLWLFLQKSSTVQLKRWTTVKKGAMYTAIPPTYQQVYIWSIQLKQTETMDVMWMRGRGSTTPCNWFSKPESSEVALHMELNCDLPLYQHFHNPLPTLQQAPWQRTEADNTLSKQVHIAADNTLFTGFGSDWFGSQVSQWAESELLLLNCKDYGQNQQ